MLSHAAVVLFIMMKLARHDAQRRNAGGHARKAYMTPEIQKRLDDFERRHKPDSRAYLARFREEVVYLYFKGYSLKTTFEYVKEQGVGCSLRTFERWVKENIDFSKEQMPDEVKRARPWPAETQATGEGGRAGQALQVASQPLVADRVGFSLAGASPDDPALRGGVAPDSSKLPKHHVLVDEEGGPPLQLSKDAVKPITRTKREEALAAARERREQGFKNPVDRALESREK
jgi:hypothetical protein